MKSTASSVSSTAVVKGGVYKSKNADSIKQNADVRDLKLYCDQLYKEIERKDSRNDAVTKEMQALRTANADLQREMRMMSVSYDKMKNEKLQLSSEILKGKEEHQKDIEKIKSLQDVQHMSDSLDRNKVHIKTLKDDISTLKGTIDLRDRKIEALERELEIAHRTMNVQEKFEGKLKSHAHHFHHPNSQTGLLDMDASTAHYNRESMRSLYYELGKRQTDMHNLAISLADSQKEKEDLLNQVKAMVSMKDSVVAENKKLQEKIDELHKDKESLHKQIDTLHQEMSSKDEYHIRLKSQTEEVSNRHAEMSYLHDQMMEEKNNEILEVLELLEQNERLRNDLQVKYDTAQNTMEYLENASKLVEQKASKEVSKYEEEIRDLKERLSDFELTVAQVNKLRMTLQNVNEQLDENELRIATLQQEVQNYEVKIIPSLEYNLSNSNAQLLNKDKEIKQLSKAEAYIVQERNEAIEALKQTIAVTREVAAKYQRERELRYNAENTVASLQKAKENISSAVLEALQLERQKTALLERTLNDVPQEYRVSQSLNGLPHPPHHSMDSRSLWHSVDSSAIKHHPASLSISASGANPSAVANAAATASAIHASLAKSRTAPHSYTDFDHGVVYNPVRVPKVASANNSPARIPPPHSMYAQSYPNPSHHEFRADSLNNSHSSSSESHSSQKGATVVATMKGIDGGETVIVSNNDVSEETHPFTMVNELKKLRDELRHFEDSTAAAASRERSHSHSASKVNSSFTSGISRHLDSDSYPSPNTSWSVSTTKE